MEAQKSQLELDCGCIVEGTSLVETCKAHRLKDKSQKRLNPQYGYHSVKIQKGVYGEVSKIREELEELEDAERMGVKIMAMCELADLIGAIREFAIRKYNLKLSDLHDMAKLTRKAFESGHRE